jgi:predicted hydrocarbon binding protein
MTLNQFAEALSAKNTLDEIKTVFSEYHSFYYAYIENYYTYAPLLIDRRESHSYVSMRIHTVEDIRELIADFDSQFAEAVEKSGSKLFTEDDIEDLFKHIARIGIGIQKILESEYFNPFRENIECTDEEMCELADAWVKRIKIAEEFRSSIYLDNRKK